MFRAQSTDSITQRFARDVASPFNRFYEGGWSRRPSVGGNYRAQSEGPLNYGSSIGYGRLSRASSIAYDDGGYGRARARSVDPSSFGRQRGFYDYLFGRSRSKARTASPTPASSYFDRYTELASGGRSSRPIIDGYYNHFRPYYWYSTAPRTVSYFYPFSDWRYTPRYHARSPSIYSYSPPNHSYVWRLHNAIDYAKSSSAASRASSSSAGLSSLQDKSRMSRTWPGFYNRLNPYYTKSSPFSLIYA